jgi:predicted KAP-like P-loop ATPase
MLIKPPELDKKKITGFAPDIDIFERKPLGDAICNLFESTAEDLVLGLDGQWGEGKSTFALMLSAHLNQEKNVHTIYFDAFKNDYQKDAFLSIASEIQELLESQSPKSKTEFKNSLIKASKAITRGAMRVGIKTLSAGLLDETILDELGTADQFGEEISNGFDKALAAKLDETKSDKASLETFKIVLEKHISDLGKGKPIVFIIDELDRCRPDFCLELIEQIKHLFSVKNLKFLLVTNKTQLHASINKRYGSNINPHTYLQKFVDLWIELPRQETEYTSHTETYFNYLIKNITTAEEKISNILTLDTLKNLFITNKTSYRGIQKAISYLSIFHNTTKNTQYIDYYQTAIALCCFSKAEQPALIDKILSNPDYDTTMSTLFPFQNITGHRSDYTQTYTQTLLKYLASNEADQKTMIQNREIASDYGRSPPKDFLKKINNTLNLFAQ